MNYQIAEGGMQAVIDSHGAELVSLKLKGHEYLWQGDPAFWSGHAPVLFPFVGRLQDGACTLEGKRYEMRIHGLAKYCEFQVAEQEDKRITFVLSDTEETRAQYPFSFRFFVTYEIEGQKLVITEQVENTGEKWLYFGLGGHPGFNAPLDENGSFEDCYLEFGWPSNPSRVVFSDSVLLTGKTERYPLEDGKILRLTHSLFDHDAVVLQDMPRVVSLKSTKSARSVTVSFPGMPWVGFWHAVKKPAPYVCIEPWVTLPGREGVIEDLSCIFDLPRLAPAKTYENVWSIELQ